MKRIKYLIIIILVAAIAYGANYFIERAPIFTGYAAKDLASWTFLTHRTKQDIEKAMQGHILDDDELIGLYKLKKFR